MTKVSKEFWDDILWSEEHYSELMEKFPDKWVAIVDKKPVTSGESIKAVERETEKVTGKDKSEIPIVFVECGAHIY
jgi:hypothetical protein